MADPLDRTQQTSEGHSNPNSGRVTDVSGNTNRDKETKEINSNPNSGRVTDPNAAKT
ncbi:hypothetical protein Sste5344_006090 [Sporothrix stenoceras]